MELKTYEIDEQIQVTKFQYHKCMIILSGIIAGRIDGENHYIKIMCFQDYANRILSNILWN